MINAENIKNQCEIHNIDVDETQANKLAIYSNMVLAYNGIMNLTRNDSEDKMIDRNIIDCLRVVPYIKDKEYIADIGCGAGLPGIVAAIMTNKRYVLIDSIKKKTEFVKKVIDTLGLNCEVLNDRAENVARSKVHREQFDAVISRAAAPLNILLEYSIPLLKTGGKLAAMKGSNVQEEIKHSNEALKELKAKIEHDNVYKNNDDIERHIIIIRKLESTSDIYPRDTKKIIKRPL